MQASAPSGPPSPTVLLGFTSTGLALGLCSSKVECRECDGPFRVLQPQQKRKVLVYITTQLSVPRPATWLELTYNFPPLPSLTD